MIKIILTFILLFFIQGCVSMLSGEKKIDPLQLQEDIQRFYSRFTERVVESFIRNNSLVTDQRMTVLREYLLYDQEALKITTAPYPIVNLFDMLVFVKLSKGVIERYWIPEVYGPKGEILLQAFRESENDINEVALKYIKPEQLETLNQGVRSWLETNPDTIRVEKIRMADFSKNAQHKDAGISFSISQIFVDTKSTVAAVDDAVLLGNRALFLTQHLPLILRLQARIGTNEILEDTISRFQAAPERMEEGINAATPLITELDQLVRDTRGLMAQIKQATSRKGGMTFGQTLSKFESLIDKSTILLGEVENLKPEDTTAITKIKNEIHDFVIFIATILILVAAAVSILWWGGYYVSKRMLQGRTKEPV